MNKMKRLMILSNIDKIRFNDQYDHHLKLVAKSELPVCYRWQGSKGWVYWKADGLLKGYAREYDKVLTKEILIKLLTKE